MRTGDQIGRYRLIDVITSDAGSSSTIGDVVLWRAYDTILDRDVSLRILDARDIRVAAVIGAAQASSRVDDQRLLRVLDVVEEPSTEARPGIVAVVSEWATGRNLEHTIHDRQGAPLAPTDALAIVTDVSRTLATAQTGAVAHGRLRPASVFITDAGEIRVRGLAVDAALFGIPEASDGSIPSDPFQGDADNLGALLYLLTTGTWPGSRRGELPAAPRNAGSVLNPSSVRASVPAGVDDLVSRSLLAAIRPRGVTRIHDATAFSSAAGASLDYIAPVAIAQASGWRRAARGTAVALARIAAVLLAIALVAGLAWAGWQMVTATSIAPDEAENAALAEMLTSEAQPYEDTATQDLEQKFAIASIRSYDPFGDDNGNGKPDKRKGREGEDLTATINDIDPDTAWLTDEYSSSDLDGKGGTGLIIDLGETQAIKQVSLRMLDRGGDVDIRVADQILPDPALWTPIESVPNAPANVTIRTPRPVNARYVLVWLPSVPLAPDAGYGVYQSGITSIEVSG